MLCIVVGVIIVIYTIIRALMNMRFWKESLINRAVDRNNIIVHFSNELKPYKFGFSMA